MRRGSVLVGLAILAVALISGPARAGHGKALGSVGQANNSLIDNGTAMAGASVYACDVLDTDQYGDLRVQFHGSQIALGTSSEVVLDGSADAVRVIVVSGSVSFSAPSSAALIMETPAGTLREASGQAYTGTVSITGPKELVVSSVHGTIVVNGGAAYSVPAGKSARVTFDHAADTSCHGPGYVRSSDNPSKLKFELIGTGATAVVGDMVWKELSESETKPDEF
jgi:hypothetical protein